MARRRAADPERERRYRQRSRSPTTGSTTSTRGPPTTPATSAPGSPATLKIDGTLPADTTALPTDWSNSRTLTLSATDATSGVAQIEYKINGAAAVQVASDTASITLPSDGTFTIAHRVYDVAGQLTSYKTDTVKVDTVVPALTSAAAPTTWQITPLSVDITGTDVGSGIDHAEWKLGATGTVTSGTPAVIGVDGTPTLYTRVVDKAGNPSAWRTGEHQGRHDAAGEHDPGDRLRVAAHEPDDLGHGHGRDVRRGAGRVEARQRFGDAGDDARRFPSPRTARTRCGRGSSTWRATPRTGVRTTSASTRRLRRCPRTAVRRPGATLLRSARCPPTAASPGWPRRPPRAAPVIRWTCPAAPTRSTPTAPPRSTSAPSTVPATSPRRPLTSRSTACCLRPALPARRAPASPGSAPSPAATRCPAWPGCRTRSTAPRRRRSLRARRSRSTRARSS